MPTNGIKFVSIEGAGAVAKRLLKSVTATDDAGNTYTIGKYEEFIESAPDLRTGRVTPIPTGLLQFLTADGQDVEYVSKGRYRVNGALVSSDDPDAP